MHIPILSLFLCSPKGKNRFIQLETPLREICLPYLHFLPFVEWHFFTEPTFAFLSYFPTWCNPVNPGANLLERQKRTTRWNSSSFKSCMEGAWTLYFRTQTYTHKSCVGEDYAGLNLNSKNRCLQALWSKSGFRNFPHPRASWRVAVLKILQLKHVRFWGCESTSADGLAAPESIATSAWIIQTESSPTKQW